MRAYYTIPCCYGQTPPPHKCKISPCHFVLHETQAVADSMSAADDPYEGFASYYDFLSNMWVTHNDVLHMVVWFFTDAKMMEINISQIYRQTQ